ncbi:MAG: NADH:flavin oxidoreductase [Deltaproteobacteria bacterium]|jgi:2,4-dienoyl-CoA reductase-like NADH-dependent reductase (Old Yellow Enzyme family)|nr:NADH:flavin oxidoreductase [Deltaproteobacteria bacterium]
MTRQSPFAPLSFSRGPAMKNRFMLAPLTNLQSHDDGRLSEDEFHWLTMRARGGFGATMTCASHVQARGKGFPGQLGVFGDEHLDGLGRLAAGIRKEESVAILQLHHAGMRSPREQIGEAPVCPSANAETGARALEPDEVEELAEDFVAAALRAERAGFDGVEVHGAHGYVLAQFLSAEVNTRDDRYGGSLENRSRILFDVVEGIRERCRPDFVVGVRLSAERFGVTLAEAREVAQRLMREDQVDFVDMSLWDVFKEPAEEEFQGRSLLSYFTELDRGRVRLGAAGKITSAADVRACMEAGLDFVLPGRAGILHHDFPMRVRDDTDFEQVALPVSADYLRAEGLGEAFIGYMSTWGGFVGAPETGT